MKNLFSNKNDSTISVSSSLACAFDKAKKNNTVNVFLDIENKLAAAGDWCGNARVESAFTHGVKLVDELKPLLIK